MSFLIVIQTMVVALPLIAFLLGLGQPKPLQLRAHGFNFLSVQSFGGTLLPV
jgi:hypothetical protein